MVFRATFVSRRGAIMDLYRATLKRGTPGLNTEFSFVPAAVGKGDGGYPRRGLDHPGCQKVRGMENFPAF